MSEINIPDPINPACAALPTDGADNPTDVAIDSAAAIAEVVARYSPLTMSEGQRVALLDDVRALVLRAAPYSARDAEVMMSSACTFLADVAPDNGAVLEECLTDAELAAWQNSRCQVDAARSVINVAGRVERLLRVADGLPARVQDKRPASKARPPATLVELAAIVEVAVKAGPAQCRGVVAAIGAGLSAADAEGFVIERSQDGYVLALRDGTVRPVHGAVSECAEEALGQMVFETDWAAIRRDCASAGIALDSQIAVQTYRWLVASSATPIASSMRLWGLSEAALENVIPYLFERDDVDPATAAAMLRGSARARNTPAGTAPDAGSPSAADNRSITVGSPSTSTAKRPSPSATPKPPKRSKAAARRRAAEIRAKEETPADLPEPLKSEMDGYRPRTVDDDVWAAIRPAFEAVMVRSELSSVENFKKHRGIVVLFLAWRLENHQSLEIKDAFTFAEINRFYKDGLGFLDDHTRNDYLSRLRTLASRVNPGVDAPAKVMTAGHVTVRPGYSAAEEEAIRWTATRQSKPRLRRELSALVALGFGAGLDSVDMRDLRARDCTKNADGSWVITVPDPRPRTVIVRHDYENLLATSLEGLEPEQFVLGTNRSKNPAGRILAQAGLSGKDGADVARMRSTWLSRLMCEAVPLQVILNAAGLRSARTLIDLIDTLPALPTDAISVLRGEVSR